jgi:hypothetical protein
VDPDEALKNAREAVQKLIKYDYELTGSPDTTKLVESFQALDEWMSRGGFLPQDWAKGRIKYEPAEFKTKVERCESCKAPVGTFHTGGCPRG